MVSCKQSIQNGLSSCWRSLWRQRPMDKDILNTKLSRCMTTFDLTLLGMGHMMGSGIYVITGTIMLMDAGPSTILSYLFAGIVSFMIAICSAQFSVNIPKTGSSYCYVYIVGGEFLAFLTGWTLIMEYMISVSAVASSLSAYLNSLTGGAIHNGTIELLGNPQNPILRQMDFVGPGAMVLVFIIVAIGVKSTAIVNNIMVIVNVSVLLVIIGSGMAVGNVSNLTSGPGGFFPFGFEGTIRATGVLFYAYLGFDAICMASEETTNPTKSVPIAFAASLGSATILYCLAALALGLLVPYNLVNANASFALAFNRYHNMSWVGYVVSTGAVFGLSCSLLGQTYCLPRGVYALAEDGLIFSHFKYINKWTKTPLVAIGVTLVMSLIITLLVPINQLVEMVSGGALFAMALMVACLIKVHYVPASECPLELINPLADSKGKETEKLPILSKEMSNLEKIGKPRFNMPLLNRYSNDAVIHSTIVTLCLSLIVLTACIFAGYPYLIQGAQWLIFLIITSSITTVASLIIMLSFHHNTSFARFKVPLFPWIPVAALVIDLALLMSLNIITWARVLGWMGVGLLIYFFYGIRHSTLSKEETYLELEVKESKSNNTMDSTSLPDDIQESQ